MLYHQRKREAELATAEAEGQSFWTESLDRSIRVAIWHLFSDVPRIRHYQMVERMLREFDLLALPGSVGFKPPAQVQRAWLTFDDPLAVSMVELMHEYVVEADGDDEGWGEWFESEVNERLASRRVGFELVDGQMIAKDSQELHAEVVAPVLRLLSGRSGWENVETAYQDALRELHGGSPGDAITDAGTALQEALTALGCKGNALGDLLKDAKKRGLLAAHDAQLEKAIVDIGHWVSADRSTKGDAHNAEPALQDDAWLTVHVVGALILRLVAGTER